MDLLKFSKFKFQLQALISEIRELREMERSATSQLHLSIQKQKQTEDDCARKLQELRSELDSSLEQRQKLEKQISHVQSDNALLENKQKVLQGTIQNLLQSREAFINAYEEHTCEMKRSIQTKDRRLSFLSEKIMSRSQLFDSIVNEALSIKQVLDGVQCSMSEKEQVVAGLRSKMDKVAAFEELFIEKINKLEQRLRNDQDELQRKDKIISGLEAQLEMAKNITIYEPQLEELQKTLSIKEVVIQNLASDKKALHDDVGNLRAALQRIQHAVMHMNVEDKRTLSLQLEGQEESEIIERKEDDRIEDVAQSTREIASSNAADMAVLFPHWEYSLVSTSGKKNNCNRSTLKYQLTCSSPHLAPAKDPSAANSGNVSFNEVKVNCKASSHNLDSEGSTTQEVSRDPACWASPGTHGLIS